MYVRPCSSNCCLENGVGHEAGLTGELVLIGEIVSILEPCPKRDVGLLSLVRL